MKLKIKPFIAIVSPLVLIFLYANTSVVNAQPSITSVAHKTAFAIRCKDLQIINPYARGYIEWTSSKLGPGPYVVPVMSMTTSIDRISGGTYAPMQANTSQLTAYDGKFSVGVAA